MKIAQLLFSLLLVIITPQTVNGCSCVPPFDVIGDTQKWVEKEKKSAMAVFSGAVTKIIRPIDKKGVASGTIKVEILVIDAWKGVSERKVNIYTTTICCICGYPFKLGQQYLIYAFGENADQLWTNICSRSVRLKYAQDDIKYLGKPLAIK